MVEEVLGTVLVVEDERDLRFILATQLRAAGFEVIEATDGVAGVAMATERCPDLVIMDVGLPKLDGVGATRALRGDQRTKSIPVIMLTARSRSSDVVVGLEAGAQEYLLKPFDVTELLARVRSVLKLSRAHQELSHLNTKLEAEVDVKTKRLQCLYEFMRDLNRADTKDAVLDLVIRCVETMTGARRISLFLTEPNSLNLVCERAVGLDQALVEQLRVRAMEGITGQVFSSGRTLVARAFGPSAGYQRDYQTDDFLSTPLFSTSLTTHDGVLGVLNATDKPDKSPFSEEEITCIRSIADAASIALEDINRRRRLQQSVRVLLQTLGNLAEYRDEETSQHIERVSRYARVLALAARDEGTYASIITDEFIDFLGQAAPMHDIGKVGIADEILTKPGKLTDEEFQIMKTHTDIGRRVLSKAVDPSFPNPLLQMCIDIAWCHHERFDGTGYPRRIKGEAIPLAARIVSLVDAYDAITSKRRYKPAKSHADAVLTIRAEAGRHFDPLLVDAFVSCQSQFEDVRSRYEDDRIDADSTVTGDHRVSQTAY